MDWREKKNSISLPQPDIYQTLKPHSPSSQQESNYTTWTASPWGLGWAGANYQLLTNIELILDQIRSSLDQTIMAPNKFPLHGRSVHIHTLTSTYIWVLKSWQIQNLRTKPNPSLGPSGAHSALLPSRHIRLPKLRYIVKKKDLLSWQCINIPISLQILIHCCFWKHLSYEEAFLGNPYHTQNQGLCLIPPVPAFFLVSLRPFLKAWVWSLCLRSENLFFLSLFFSFQGSKALGWSHLSLES